MLHKKIFIKINYTKKKLILEIKPVTLDIIVDEGERLKEKSLK
jgi:hypothetical protein